MTGSDNHNQREAMGRTLQGLSEASEELAELRESEDGGHRVIDGRYQLVSQLGSGASGTVFEAMQLSVGRRVALKLLHPSHQEQESYQRRFHREARAVARLNHPNCITLHDFGYAEQVGVHFIVMEHVEGLTLRDWMRQKEPTLQQKLRVLKEVALALAHAHGKQVLHRDLKPENILISPDDQVRVLDFGLARLFDQSEGSIDEVSRLTEPGRIYGTPPYMSPEQCRGELELTAAVDLYALGVMLFEAVEGRLPFEGRRVVDVLLKHVTDPVPELTNSDLPARLNSLVAALLAKQPEQRPATAWQVANVLDEVICLLEEAPKTADSASPAERPSSLLEATVEGPPIEPCEQTDPTDHTDQTDQTAQTDEDEPASLPPTETVDPLPSGRNEWLIAGAIVLLIAGLATALGGFGAAGDTAASASSVQASTGMASGGAPFSSQESTDNTVPAEPSGAAFDDVEETASAEAPPHSQSEEPQEELPTGTEPAPDSTEPAAKAPPDPPVRTVDVTKEATKEATNGAGTDTAAKTEKEAGEESTRDETQQTSAPKHSGRTPSRPASKNERRRSDDANSDEDEQLETLPFSP